jgi:hypothetical protein
LDNSPALALGSGGFLTAPQAQAVAEHDSFGFYVITAVSARVVEVLVFGFAHLILLTA